MSFTVGVAFIQDPPAQIGGPPPPIRAAVQTGHDLSVHDHSSSMHKTLHDSYFEQSPLDNTNINYGGTFNQHVGPLVQTGHFSDTVNIGKGSGPTVVHASTVIYQVCSCTAGHVSSM
jgi:hypothetical protein